VLIEHFYSEQGEVAGDDRCHTEIIAGEDDHHDFLQGDGQGNRCDQNGGFVFANGVDKDLVDDQTENGHQHYPGTHTHQNRQPHFMWRKVDAVGCHHIKGGMGDVDDAGHTKNQGEPDGQQGIGAAADYAGNKNVQYHKASHNKFSFIFNKRCCPRTLINSNEWSNPDNSQKN